MTFHFAKLILKLSNPKCTQIRAFIKDKKPENPVEFCIVFLIKHRVTASYLLQQVWHWTLMFVSTFSVCSSLPWYTGMGYSEWANVDWFLYNAYNIHTNSCSGFCLAFTSQLGVQYFAQVYFTMRTGADWSTGLPISGRPALPPQLQPPISTLDRFPSP